MTTVSVVYHTGTGHTRALAESIAKGAGGVTDVTVHLLEIKSTQIDTDGRWKDDEITALLNASDAIIGSNKSGRINLPGDLLTLPVKVVTNSAHYPNFQSLLTKCR
jgi:hypothetical protein